MRLKICSVPLQIIQLLFRGFFKMNIVRGGGAMYKLIIADDEHIIREGLNSLIKWKEIGFDVVVLFQDGVEIIEYVKSNEVDVILTDIMMLTTTGIDVAKYIYKNKPHIKVVFISGFKEFEFAKKGIEYGVENYLLKPTNVDEVTETFTKIYLKLVEESKQKQFQENSQYFDEALPLLKEKFFIDIVMNNENEHKDYIEKIFKMIYPNLDIYNTPCFLLNIEIIDYNEYISNNWKYGIEKLEYTIKNSIANYDHEADFNYIYKSREQILVLVVFKMTINDENLLAYKIQSEIERFEKEFSSVFKFKVNITAFAVFVNLFEIQDYDTMLLLDGIKNYQHEKQKLVASSGIDETSESISTIIMKAKAYIKSQYLQGVTLEGVADELYISTPYLSRIFKKETKENFIDFVTRLKMEKAIELLENSTYKVYEICNMLGYKDIKYFTNLFKNYYNTTPTGYKNTRR